MSMKQNNKNTRRPTTASNLSATARSDRDKKFNTCYEYFKVKKSSSSCGNSRKFPTTQAGKESCSSSIIADKTKSQDRDLALTRPRRLRYDSMKQSDVKHQASSGLCIEDVQMLVEAQSSYDGGVNCYVCGKLYKSKVCFIKHIWEHSVYWNIFKSAKNHERVLSIQAAIILYCGMTSQTNGASKSDLCNLLVTSPHSSEMKQERDSGVTPNSDQLNNSFLVLLSEKCAEKSPLVVDFGKEKYDENAIGNLHHSDATKYPADVVSNSQNASSDNCIQMSSTIAGECWHQPWSHIAQLRSEMSSTSQAHSTLPPTPPKLQTNPALFSPPKRHSYLAEILPPPKSYPAVFSPPLKSQSYPAVFSPPLKSQSYPAVFSPPLKSQSYPTVFSPPLKSYMNPIMFSSPIKPRCFPQPQMFPIFSSPLPKPQTFPISTAERPPALMLATSLPAPQLSSGACHRRYKNSRRTSTDTYGDLENSEANFVSPLKRKRED